MNKKEEGRNPKAAAVFIFIIVVIPLICVLLLQKGAEMHRSLRSELKTDTLQVPNFTYLSHQNILVDKEYVQGKVIIFNKVNTKNIIDYKEVAEKMKLARSEFWKSRKDRDKVLFLFQLDQDLRDSILYLKELASELNIDASNMHLVTAQKTQLDSLSNALNLSNQKNMASFVEVLNDSSNTYIFRNRYDVLDTEKFQSMLKHMAFRMPGDQKKQLSKTRE